MPTLFRRPGDRLRNLRRGGPGDDLAAEIEAHRSLRRAALEQDGLPALEADRAGDGLSAAVAVISDACWRRRFGGDPAAIGRVVQVDGVGFTVIGVTPPGFSGVSPGLAPEITVPLTAPGGSTLLQPSGLHMMGRLADGLTLSSANAMLRTVWPEVLEATTPASTPGERRAMYLGRTTGLEPGRGGFSRVRNQFQEPLWVLLGLAALLSAAACASAASLLLARGLNRRRELAVRLAIGASRARIIRQCLVEATVWTAMGGSRSGSRPSTSPSMIRS